MNVVSGHRTHDIFINLQIVYNLVDNEHVLSDIWNNMYYKMMYVKLYFSKMINRTFLCVKLSE